MMQGFNVWLESCNIVNKSYELYQFTVGILTSDVSSFWEDTINKCFLIDI